MSGTATTPSDVNGQSAGTPMDPSDMYNNFNLTAAQGDDDLTRMVTCFLQATDNEYNGMLGEHYI